MTMARALGRKTLTAAAVFALAACGGDGGGTTPAPAPAPQPLSWLDVPEEAVSIRLGDPQQVDLRLSAAVEASFAIEAADELLTVQHEVLRAGVVRVVLEGVTPGESGVALTATATGYLTANARFDVVVDETGFGVVVIPDTAACQRLEDLEEIFRLLFEAGLLDSVQFLTEKALAGQCGAFEEGAEIEWNGEEEWIWFGTPAIRVLGSPRTGRDLAPGPRVAWWTLKDATSFGEPPEESSFERSIPAVMDRVRALITAAGPH